MDMDRKKLEKKLQDKLETNFRSYIQQLQSKPAPAKLVYEKLMDGGYSPDFTEYLLCFENPLEVVRDQWMNEQGTAHLEEMEHVLLNIVDKGIGEGGYEMDKTYQPPALDEGVSLC